ncbi:MAG: PQQ-binding-like beta-propeller repeat protein [Pseudomonadales bacterium]|nr:PQQ-binding-like beta-propeller repeat protein [Pseudomonadales bacterium]
MFRTLYGVVFVMACILGQAVLAAENENSGESLYTQYCAVCHANPTDVRTPPRAALSGYTANSIYHALTQGIMQPQGSAMTDGQKILLAEFLSGGSYDVSLTGALSSCTQPMPVYDLSLSSNWNGWGNGLNNQRYQSSAGTAITLDNIDQLELAWAFGLEGASAARAQPSVVGSVMLMGSPSGTVYALDIDSGCLHWSFPAASEVRTAVTVAYSATQDRHLAVFADTGNRVYVLDARSGERLWSDRVDPNPYARSTGSPVVYQERIFVPVSSAEVSAAGRPDHVCCTFRGNVAAYELNSGEKLWHTYIMEEAREVGTNSAGNPILAPSGAPIWQAPTIDPERNRIYVGTGQNYTRPTSATSDSVIAFNMDTGNMDWVFQSTAQDAFTMACTLSRGTPHPNCPQAGPDVDIGAPVLKATLSDGRDILVAGTKGAVVYGLDPDNEGAVLWQTSIGKGGALGGVHWGMSFVGDTLFVPVSDRTGISDEGPTRQPGLHAIDMKTGERTWYAEPVLRCAEGQRGCMEAYSAPATASDDFVVSGSLNGHLFVHEQKTGAIIWEYDSLQDYATINGVAAKGGAFDATGPVLSGRYMIVSSGYATFGQLPGNVVLVFRLKQ